MSAAKVHVLLGVDCDRPRIQFRDSPAYGVELTTVADYIVGLADAWGGSGASWTLFMCGSFLAALDSAGLTTRVRSAAARYAQCEVGCHSYWHRPVAEVPGRPDLVVPGIADIDEDLQMNQAALEEFTGGPCGGLFGFRAPYGTWRGGLSAKVVECLGSCRAYSSSVLRSRAYGICPPLVTKSSLRQPFHYPNGLWEFPSHGWHDTVFAGMSATLTQGPERSTAVEHYTDLLRQAADVSRAYERAIYLGLVLHPLAMSVYDPEFSLLPQLRRAVPRGATVSFWSYRRGHESVVGMASR